MLEPTSNVKTMLFLLLNCQLLLNWPILLFQFSGKLNLHRTLRWNWYQLEKVVSQFRYKL